MSKVLSLQQLESLQNRTKKVAWLRDVDLERKTGVGIISAIKGHLNRIPVTEELEFLNRPRSWDGMTVQQKKETILELYEMIREKVEEMRIEESERNLFIEPQRPSWHQRITRSRNAYKIVATIVFTLLTIILLVVILFRAM